MTDLLTLPVTVALPLIICGGILVTLVFVRLRRRPAALPPAPPRSAVTDDDLRNLDARVLECLEGLRSRFSVRVGGEVRSQHFIAVEANLPRLEVWFITDSDAQRDLLLALPDYQPTCHAALLSSGFPPEAALLARFHAQSEETVQRDWAGAWWHVFH